MTMVLFLGSCGPGEDFFNIKGKTAGPSSTELSAFIRETPCLPQKGAGESLRELDDLNNAVNELVDTATKFSHLYSNQFFINLMPPRHLGTRENFLVGPEDALVLSVKELRKELNELKASWFDKVKLSETELIENEERLVEVEDLKSLEEVHQKIHFLKKKVDRFQSVSCAIDTLKDRSDQDVRSLYILKKKVSDGAKFDSKEDKDILRPILLDMCSEYNSEAICSVDFMLRDRKDELDIFYNKQIELHEKRIDSFYRPFPATQWKCQKEDGKTVIEVVMDPNKELKQYLFGSLSFLTSLVEEKWSSENVKVKLIWDEAASKKVSIHWSDKNLSFVDKARPYEMVLAHGMTHNQLLLTISHELGHVLGLPDCYHEFYDEKEKAVIYYTLDKTGKNLMCNLDDNAVITSEALESLIENVCL